MYFLYNGIRKKGFKNIRSISQYDQYSLGTKNYEIYRKFMHIHKELFDSLIYACLIVRSGNFKCKCMHVNNNYNEVILIVNSFLEK